MQTTNTAGGALSANFTTACTAVARTPAYKVYLKWDGVNWSDESLNVLSHQGEARLTRPDDGALLGQGDISGATVLMNNRQYRYSKLAATGDASLRAALGGRAGIRGVEARIYQGFMVGAPAAAEYVQIFQGVVYDWSEDDDSKRFTLFLRDVGNKYVQTKISTPLRKDYRLDEWIAEVADKAGIAEGERSLEPSIYTVPWAWADDESAVEEMWKAAQADGGRLYWDHHGVMRFENLLHWAGASSVWTVTADHLENLAPTPQPDLLATEVLAEWQPRQVSDLATVYRLDERKFIGPGQTVSFEARLTQPVWTLFLPEKVTDFQAVSSGGGDMNEQAVITLDETERYAQRVRVHVRNDHGVLPIVLLWFQLRGVRLEGRASQEVFVPATTAPLSYPHQRKLSGNVYIQSDTQARALATFLAERNSRLQPVWRLDLMRGTPAFELGDRVTFSNGRIVNAARSGHVLAHSWQLGEDGFFSQTLELLDREYLFPYEDYFVIGTTALGGGRAWY